MKNFLSQKIKKYIYKFRQIENQPFGLVDQGTQILLKLKYKELAKKNTLPSFRDVEFRSFSQNCEDGILLFIFSVIGEVNRKSIELCCGNGIECNTANLIINHNWEAILFDGNNNLIEEGKRFYGSHPSTFLFPPKMINAWITCENINDLISAQITGEIDLLSLDMDGVDWWIWKSLEAVSPRVVILEYNNVLGPEKSLTIPNNSSFVASQNDYGISYCGASLNAFVKLSKEKGYRLIGVEKYSFNAIFMRNDVGEKFFPEVDPKECFFHSFAKHSYQKRYSDVKDLEWIEV